MAGKKQTKTVAAPASETAVACNAAVACTAAPASETAVACNAAACTAAPEIVCAWSAGPVKGECETCDNICETAPGSGRVKWFNNKAGYGFITVNDCETNEERDMFVHHSEIKVEQTQYKYLVQGEYVEFVIGPINRENKTDVHATNVRGINGGKLMCETRNEVRSFRPIQQSSMQQPPRQMQQQQPRQAQQQPRQMQQQPRQPRQDDRRPQLDKADQSEWMVVPRRTTEHRKTEQQMTSKPRQRQPGIEIAQ